MQRIRGILTFSQAHNCIKFSFPIPMLGLSDLTWLGGWVFPNETRVFSDDFAAAVSERARHPLFEY